MEFCLRRYFDRLRWRAGVILDIDTALFDGSLSQSAADTFMYYMRYSQSSLSFTVTAPTIAQPINALASK